MSSEQLLDAIGLVSDELVANAVPSKYSKHFRSISVTAACLCLTVVGVFAAFRTGFLPGFVSSDDLTVGQELAPVTEELQSAPLAPPDMEIEDEPVYTELEAGGFRLGDCVYYPISFEDRIRFGLLPENAVGLDGDHGYFVKESDNSETLTAVPFDLSIQAEDIGKPMGYAEGSADSSLNDCAIYHYAKLPEYLSICIVDTTDGYAFYTSGGYMLDGDRTDSFDRVLDAYGMPGQVEQLEILTGDWQVLETTDDPDRIAAFCDLLKGKENHGLQANEERYAALWKETYGNEDVYLHENGSMIYTDMALHDQAHALWHENERLLRFTTADGFRFYVDYNPSIRAFSGYGYYALTEEEAHIMNQLLGI